MEKPMVIFFSPPAAGGRGAAPPPPPPQAASTPHARTKDAKRNLAMRTLPWFARRWNGRMRIDLQPMRAPGARQPPRDRIRALVKVETLFLDAGGVLVNPNFERVADALRAHGVPAEGAALRGAEAHAKKELDTDSTVNATNDASRGWLYFELVLKHAGIARDARTAAALRDLAAYHAEHNLWETVPDEVPGGARAAARGRPTPGRAVERRTAR